MPIPERIQVALCCLADPKAHRPSYGIDRKNAKRQLKEFTEAIVCHDQWLDPTVMSDFRVEVVAASNQHFIKLAMDYIFPRPSRV